MFSSLSKCVFQTLWSNSITEIEDGTFNGMVKFVYLHEGFNSVRLLRYGKFQGFKKLTDLKLLSNK